MEDQQLLRYARHILLDEFGVEAQERILASRILVVGAGGLGSPVVAYLAASGVGSIILVDDDQVELSNLQRQIAHTTDRLGWDKVESAKLHIEQLNPEVKVTPVVQRLDEAGLMQWVQQVDLVLDCCDNFATRHAINRACVALRKPLVSGAAIRFSGQVSTYDLRQPEAPCYHCLFPEADDVEELRCATTGVLSPLLGMVGSAQAVEALKLLGGFGEPLVGRLLSVDAFNMNWHTVRFRKDPACPVCSSAAAEHADHT
ncbi:molybdopterin biosynthesis protein MoeB [Alcaligenes faecalis]|uniref:HesA/MoeB/ThiF family protein n=1 Tax=Alcaligenes faecalis TaxID=511 RepID=UPI0005F8B108|nr:HesA/MoeB/ThiF family protein [Alcaligenes faecalis]MBW4787350.1 HesA/MoeB/ThiF family protein [Alcaligenes faecalis subsp. faecalis]ALO39107.1 molybdopterin biosynthesis protein MoeB [Alcaligenes faecalis]OSZ44496.1 molybdopterin biosynthesis protein MoeB [Alcaligenes faecalis]OSZ50340.1 molybdopterin biosynthesis protein MoeB [Alcaligenes faecalis]OSZ52523.1 molybdopterin biosynthesis protein MoeB [Alcaligenes faecalis]